jgi:hypothetical protein
MVTVQFVYKVSGDRTFTVSGKQYRFSSGVKSKQTVPISVAFELTKKWPAAFKIVQGD